MVKYFLEKRGKGNYRFYKIKSASGRKLRELEAQDVELFDTRKEAYDKAIDLKRRN